MSRTGSSKNKHNWHRFGLTLISLSPLFFISLIVVIASITFDCGYDDTRPYLTNQEALAFFGISSPDSLKAFNGFSFFGSSTILLLIGLLLCTCCHYRKIRSLLSRTEPGHARVTDCTKQSSRALDFYVAVILPLVCLTDIAKLSVFFCYWLSTAAVFILTLRTSAYWTNPMLVLIGFNAYCVSYESLSTDDSGTVNAITRDTLRQGNLINMVAIDESTSFASITYPTKR